jgi:truncated hemoglobin YjbI
MNPTVTIYDGATGQTTVREMTDAEYAVLLEEQANAPVFPEETTDETPSPA